MARLDHHPPPPSRGPPGRHRLGQRPPRQAAQPRPLRRRPLATHQPGDRPGRGAGQRRRPPARPRRRPRHPAPRGRPRPRPCPQDQRHQPPRPLRQPPLRHPRPGARPGRRPRGPHRLVGHQHPRPDCGPLRRRAGRAGSGAGAVAPCRAGRPGRARPGLAGPATPWPAPAPVVAGSEWPVRCWSWPRSCALPAPNHSRPRPTRSVDVYQPEVAERTRLDAAASGLARRLVRSRARRYRWRLAGVGPGGERRWLPRFKW